MKRCYLAGLLAILILALSACGSSNTTAGGGEEAAPAPTATEAPVISGDKTHGQELFESTCMACHGPGGTGIEGLGKPFVASEFIQSQDEQQLLNFIKLGRAADDPDNTTGIAMLPKGGNPALSDEEITDIIAYLRSLQ